MVKSLKCTTTPLSGLVRTVKRLLERRSKSRYTLDLTSITIQFNIEVFMTNNATGFHQSLAELRKSFDSSTIENLQSQYLRIVGHTISKECTFYEGQYG